MVKICLVMLIPHSAPGIAAWPVELFQLDDRGAERDGRLVDQREAAGHDDPHRPALHGLLVLELADLVEVAGEHLPGRLQELVIPVQYHHGRAHAQSLGEVGPFDGTAASVFLDLGLELGEEAGIRIYVAELDADGRVGGVGEVAGQHLGEQRFTRAGVAEDQQRRLHAVRRFEVPQDERADVPVGLAAAPGVLVIQEDVLVAVAKGTVGLRDKAVDLPREAKARPGVLHRDLVVYDLPLEDVGVGPVQSLGDGLHVELRGPGSGESGAWQPGDGLGQCPHAQVQRVHGPAQQLEPGPLVLGQVPDLLLAGNLVLQHAPDEELLELDRYPQVLRLGRALQLASRCRAPIYYEPPLPHAPLGSRPLGTRPGESEWPATNGFCS